MSWTISLWYCCCFSLLSVEYRFMVSTYAKTHKFERGKIRRRYFSLCLSCWQWCILFSIYSNKCEFDFGKKICKIVRERGFTFNLYLLAFPWKVKKKTNKQETHIFNYIIFVLVVGCYDEKLLMNFGIFSSPFPNIVICTRIYAVACQVCVKQCDPPKELIY